MAETSLLYFRQKRLHPAVKNSIFHILDGKDGQLFKHLPLFRQQVSLHVQNKKWGKLKISRLKLFGSHGIEKIIEFRRFKNSNNRFAEIIKNEFYTGLH